jgi:MFS family permease
VLSIIIGWPLARMVKSRPEDLGETIDGLPPLSKEGVRKSDAAVSPPSFTVRQALRTSAFWLISLGHGFALLVVFAVNVHAITHLKESLGYTLAQASLVITVVTVGQFVGVLLGWVLGDRFDKRKVSAACMLMHAGGLLLLTYSSGPILLSLAAFIHGVGWGLRGPFMQAIRADYFGRRSIGMIIGLSSLITVLGQIAGPLIAGAFADWTGNYRAGFTVVALMAGVGSLFFMLARPPRLETASTEPR